MAKSATLNGKRPSVDSRRSGSNSSSPDPVMDAKASALQAFGDLRSLPIALPTKAKASSCTLLNEILADTMILYALYKKHHWLVAGPTFYQLHLLFDKHAEEQLALVDEIAERVQMLGGISVGDPRHAAELTTIERAPDGAEEIPLVLDRLLAARETILEKVRKGIETTEESKDFGSNDLLMGDVLRRHEMQVWFLAEHVVDTALVDA